MQYILMNQDELWASFSCVQDEFGEESAVLSKSVTFPSARQRLPNCRSFMPHSDIELSEERLNRLSEIVERQRRAILA